MCARLFTVETSETEETFGNLEARDTLDTAAGESIGTFQTRPPRIEKESVMTGEVQAKERRDERDAAQGFMR